MVLLQKRESDTMIKVNFSAADTREPIPTGLYNVVIQEIDVKPSSKSEFPYLNVKMVISEGEFEGHILYSNVSTHPKAAFKMKEFLVATGVDATALEDEIDINEEELIGADLTVSVIVGQYNGKPKNDIDTFVAPTEAPKVQTAPAKKGLKLK